jgi:hypothetical protein
VPSGRLGLVLFVTDGEPTVGERNPEAIAARVNRLRGERRIFSFGVGADLNAALVERLALEGRGTAQFVRPEEDVERAVSIVASRLTNPVVTNLRVFADGVRLVRRHPSVPSDIFAGQDFVLLTRYDGSGTARLRFEGESATGPISWTSRVEFPSSKRENAFIARLWATQRIGYLSAEKRRNGPSREIDNEIRELGEKYSIPTEFTSYLVVEPGMRLDGRGVVGTGAGAVGRRARPEAAPVTVSGGVARGTEFEAARDAAKQRSATNLAVAEETDLSASSRDKRRVGTRTFALTGETWTDLRKLDTSNVVKVKAFSDAYFKLMDTIPELRDIFALGDKVRVSGRSVTIEIGTTGTESMGSAELERIRAAW